MTFQWYCDGEPIAAGTNAWLWRPSADGNRAGSYVLVASNAFGQVSSPAMEVILDPHPAINFAVGAWGDNLARQCEVPPGLTDPRAIAAGAFHNLAAQADG